MVTVIVHAMCSNSCQGAIPEIESFEEEELMNARLLILVEQEADEDNVR